MLQKLNAKHGTDKGDRNHTVHGMSYLDIFDELWRSVRSDVRRVLEIGVRQGRSLRLWKEYFPNADIFGIDVDPACRKQEEDRIHILTASQNDGETLQPWADRSGPFDIIIDDGAHLNQLTLASLSILWPHVRSRGWYVIEDLTNSWADLRSAVGHWDGSLKASLKNGYTIRNDQTRPAVNQRIITTLNQMDHHVSDVLQMQFRSMLWLMQKA